MMVGNWTSTALGPSFGRIIEPVGPGSLPDALAVMDALGRDGAILLRGFGFTVDSFVAFSDACCTSFSTYVGGGIRYRALDRESLGAGGTLMSTTGSTQSFPMSLHGEMYYQRQRPDVLWFHCDRAPSQGGGQTTLGDACRILDELSDAAKAELRARRLRYVRRLAPEDWAVAFRTTDLDELRAICRDNAMILDEQPDGAVRIEFLDFAIARTPGGDEAFINNALLLWSAERAFRDGSAAAVLGREIEDAPPFVVRSEDGDALPDALMHEIGRVCERNTVDVDWRRGDVLLVDNRRIMHGRRAAEGEERRIVVRLGNV